MSSQWLYQVFRVAGYSLVKTEVDEHKLAFVAIVEEIRRLYVAMYDLKTLEMS